MFLRSQSLPVLPGRNSHKILFFQQNISLSRRPQEAKDLKTPYHDILQRER